MKARINDEGVGVCGANPPDTNQDQRPHFANDGDARKALAARAARCGCMLHEVSGTHNGAFLGGDWNYNKPAPCLRAVGALLLQIGGRQ